VIHIKAYWVAVLVGQMLFIEAMAASKASGENGFEAQASGLVLQAKNIGGDDQVPQTRRDQGSGYAAIGRLFTNRTFTDKYGTSRKMGTAFMVSPCVAMTNFHLISGRETLGEMLPIARRLDQEFKKYRDSTGNVKITLPNEINYSVTLQLGENSDGIYKRQVVGRPVVFGNREIQGWSGGDWIAVRFDEPNCSGTDPEIGYLPFARIPLSPEEYRTPHTAGFPGKENPTVSNRGTLYRTTRKCELSGPVGHEPAFIHTCASKPGQSGSPILVIQDGRLKVVGMIRAAEPEADQPDPKSKPGSKKMVITYEYIGVAMQAFLPEVQPVVDKDLEEHRR
jgi:V8-like Glu-specific endopeptidase